MVARPEEQYRLAISFRDAFDVAKDGSVTDARRSFGRRWEGIFGDDDLDLLVMF